MKKNYTFGFWDEKLYKKVKKVIAIYRETHELKNYEVLIKAIEKLTGEEIKK